MIRSLLWIPLLALLWACEPNAQRASVSEPLISEPVPVSDHSDRVQDKEDLVRAPLGPISQVGATQAPNVINPYFAGEGGAPDESPTPVETSSSSDGSFNLEPDVWNPGAFKRVRRRMTVPQLDQAIQDATGFFWTQNNWSNTRRFSVLQDTLGVPDWITRVVEDLTPNLVVQKFLSDAANQVCGKLMAQEWTMPTENRIFLVHIEPDEAPHLFPDKSALNLKMLLLRFHGKSYAVDDPALVPWAWLVSSTSLVTGDNLEVWTAVCLALINHPNFFSY